MADNLATHVLHMAHLQRCHLAADGQAVSRAWHGDELDITHRDSMEMIRWIRKRTNEARRRLGLPERKYPSG